MKTTIQEFVKEGLTVVNNMGETRKTTNSSIVFPNGWVASIVENSNGYSVAACDYDGYFDWNVLQPFGESGKIFCENEEEVCKALTIIEMLRNA